MDLSAFEAESVLEAGHWWYVGRRTLFLKEIRRLGISADAAILDVGTGTGTNLRMFRDAGFPNVRGIDFSPVAAAFCAQKGLGKVEIGDVCALPFADDSFDLILATDIIEHVDNDSGAVAEIRRVLKPGAPVLFTVPTFPEIWGHQDELNHHKRRYYKDTFLALVIAAGLSPVTAYYFNYFLFIPIWLARMVIKRMSDQPNSELRVNNPVLNRIFRAVFTLDIASARLLRPPFGVSALCIARKPANKPA